MRIVLYTSNCSNGVSQEDYNRLVSENEELKQEIENLKFGAQVLLTKAQNLFDTEEYDSAKTELKNVLDAYEALGGDLNFN